MPAEKPQIKAKEIFVMQKLAEPPTTIPAKRPFWKSLKTSQPLINKFNAVFVIREALALNIIHKAELTEVKISFFVELSPQNASKGHRAKIKRDPTIERDTGAYKISK